MTQAPVGGAVVLLGNYRPDGQESMLRFAESLRRDLSAAGQEVRLVSPPVLFGRLAGLGPAGMVKWLGYLDKYVVFPLVLLARFRRNAPGTVFHISDHSNAPWARVLPPDRTVITCHDLIAVRGARGDATVHAPASRTGRLLQRQILKSLLRARWVTCVSRATLDDLTRLAHDEPQWARSSAHRVLVPNAFNADFRPLGEDERRRLLKQVDVPADVPYLLHVGSDHPRKNRSLLVQLLTDRDHPWSGSICFAGMAVDDHLREKIEHRGLGDRVLEVVKPTHEQLVALYQSSAAFVFPSFSEGFGWPVIEAQQAGAVVVASNAPPMPEVGGDGAWYCSPDDPAEFAAVVSRIADEGAIRELRARGSRNVRRYDNARVTGELLEMYGLMLEG